MKTFTSAGANKEIKLADYVLNAYGDGGRLEYFKKPILIGQTYICVSPITDNNYFGLQETSTTFDTPIFQIPKGIVKARLYLWVEGQDIDIIEHAKKDYQVSVSLKFRKDHASLN